MTWIGAEFRGFGRKVGKGEDRTEEQREDRIR